MAGIAGALTTPPVIGIYNEDVLLPVTLSKIGKTRLQVPMDRTEVTTASVYWVMFMPNLLY
jgi:hypothetical protein